MYMCFIIMYDVKKSLATLIEVESLLNDGTAVHNTIDIL